MSGLAAEQPDPLHQGSKQQVVDLVWVEQGAARVFVEPVHHERLSGLLIRSL